MKTLLELFSEFFRISLFVIGGGYSILVVADRRFAKIGWIKEGELIDHLPVFQTIPGLIATHTAVYIGRQRAGVLGAAVSVIAVAIPAIAIFTAVTVGYRNFPLDNPWVGSAFIGLRAALTGIIAATIIRSWRKSLPDAFAYALMIAGVLAIGYFHLHIALVLVLAMLLGLSTVRASPSPSHFAFSFLPLLLFAQYGALCFGGGFVLVPMYIHDFVGAGAPFLRISEAEFGDIMALSQMTPGPIGVNCATFFGYRLAGIAGALIASAFLLLPGSVLVYAALSSLEKFKSSRVVRGIMRGIRPASIALMLVALFVFAKMTVYCDGTSHHWGVFLIIIATILTMSKKINLILLIVLCALTGSALRADITTKEYPDADTVIVDSREDIEYFADGTERSIEETWAKALTEKGRRSLGSDSLFYSQRYGRAKIAEVAIISPSGRTNVLDLAGLVKEMSDNSSTVANIYDPMDRIIVCNIPGVKVGDTVYVRKERSTFSARCQNQWAKYVNFEDFSPIVRASVRVKCPAALPIRQIAIRNPLGNVVSGVTTNADGSVVMDWSVAQTPQAFPEPAMPSAYRQIQHLMISTAKDWHELSKWYWGLCEPHLAKTNAAMIAKVEELKSKCEVEGKTDRDELLKAVFKFVSQEIRYMGLTMEDKSPGYAPHDVDITFDKRYGVCRDKAGLLVTMLRLAGFEAYPVLIMAGSAKMDADVPSPYFNHAIVAVAKNDIADSSVQPSTFNLQPYVLLDPTAESTKDLLPSYESDCSYLVARPDGERLLTTPMPDADLNQLKVNSSGILSEDGSMVVESEIVFRGVNDNLFRQRWLGLKPVERHRDVESRIGGAYAGAKLLKLVIEPEDLQDVSQELRARFLFQVPEALIEGETGTTLASGWLSDRFASGGLALGRFTALEKRRFPLRLMSTASAEETLRVILSATIGELRSKPGDVSLTGGYEYRRTASLTNYEFVVSRTAKLNTLEFSPEEYLDLRERIKSVEAAERRLPVFERNRLADADIRYLMRGGSVDFTGERSWVTTNVMVKQILTYDGKKSNSEFKIDYNPLIKKVKVLRASVTDRNGRTVFVGDKELTELDCNWAASAPRYPASKQLVVTLPSVEVGSVITTIVEAVTTEAPTAFRNRYYLDTVEPTDRLVYRVGKEIRDVLNPERIPNEGQQPAAHRWRKSFVVDRGTFTATCATLRRVAEVKPLDPSILNLNLQPQPSPQALRDWMSKHVRVRGPSLYELPLEKQLTDLATVVKDRYATRLDYVRTLCALLKGAGFEAQVVFASSLRGDDERYPSAYTEALCRVGDLFIGTENEYSPLGATEFDGCWSLDPVSGKEFVVHASKPELGDRMETDHVYTVRPNGAVDYDYDSRLYGEIGGWRRFFAEILPEMRSRTYQQYLGAIAQSATATSELVTDVKSYPGELKFSCFIPEYAVVEDDTITLKLPSFGFGYALTGAARKSPIGVAAADPGVQRRTVLFPADYTEIENLPKSFTVHNPMKPDEVWCEVKVTAGIVDNRLKITFEQYTRRHEACVVPPEYFPMLLEWQRRGASASERTIIVRRPR